MLFEVILLEMRAQMFHMHDTTLDHFSCSARNYFDKSYPGRWITRDTVHCAKVFAVLIVAPWGIRFEFSNVYDKLNQ